MTNDEQAPFGEQLIRQLQQQALLAEAEEAARGILHLTVDTGDPETDEDLARIHALHEFAWAGRPEARALNIAGGNDYTTIRVTGSSAAEFLDALAAKAVDLNPGWWRIRRSSR